MQQHAGKIVLNGAPSQYERWLPALDPDYAPVDGRTFTDLLNFPVKYGALVNFYDLRDEVDGDWVGFFLSDPTMMLAALDSIDLGVLESEFARLYERSRTAHGYAHKFDLLCRMFAFIQALGRRVNDGLAALTPPPAQGVARLLWQALVNAIVTSLGPQLRQLKAYAEGAGMPKALGEPVRLDWNGFLPIWELNDDCPDGSIFHGHSRVGKIDHALPHLVPIFAAFIESFTDFQRFGRARLAASLQEPDHKPQVGLYIAFARLFESAQATINTISSRYVRFYYQDILREMPAGPVGDRVFLTFALAAEEKVTSATVPAGTTFPAGQDAEGREILYASEKTLRVSASFLDVVRTLRVVRGPLMTGETKGARRAGAAVVTQRVLGSDVALAKAVEKSIAWPTFGAADTKPTPVSVTAPAILGFAVASPYLMLSGGQRDIKVVVRYSQTFKTERLDPLLDELAAIVGLSPDAIFRAVLDGAFTILASMETGWFAVPPYTTEQPDATQPSFVLHMTLQPSVPSLAAFDPTAANAPAPADDPLAAINPAPTTPTLKLYLRQQPIRLSPPPGEAGTPIDVYPLSLLDGMPVETLDVAVEVAALSDLQLQSTTGLLDASIPFPLFGAPAVVGSYLDIRKDELFAKRIDSLRVTIDWFDLPANADGFKGYYRDYTIGLDGKPQADLFNNTVFRGSIGVTNPGFWKIESNATDLCLFRTQPLCESTEAAADLCPSTAYDFAANTIVDSTPPPYYAVADGAIRVTLTAPPYGFGDDLYAQNVLNAVISDLPDPTKCQETCEAEYAVLVNSAQLIKTSIDGCSQEPDDKFRDCFTKNLDQCVAQLLLNTVQCLWGCVSKSQGRIDATTFASMKTALDEASKASQDERAKRLEQWVEMWRDKAGLKGSCLDTCMFLLDAIIGIEMCMASCAAEPANGYRACILPCVKGCQTKLEDAYAKFVRECIEACSKPKELNYPNAPWLPSAQRVSVGYSAKTAVLGGTTTDGAFFHLMPFDGYERATAPCPLLPLIADEGSLYLGFTELTPPQGLALLFQMAASAGAAGGGPAPVKFGYLSRDGWAPLGPADIAADGTNGLENSGILAVNLPAYDPTGSTVLAGDRQWLRATVASGAMFFPDTIGIFPNATIARWQDVPGAGLMLDRPLPPHTITSSVQPLPDISSIDQPMESYGGRPPESRREFEMRLGERLRHKDRAAVGWDYERLVLARFPTVWKVQALAARNAQQGNAPGDVLVAVVAGPDTLDVGDPTVPTVSSVTLGAIQLYLEGLTNPFVRLHVVNPIYVRITVAATVQFAGTEDTGTALARLNDELVRYLSPWFYDAARAAKGGRYVSKYEIETFIEAQPEVEGLWDFDISYDRPIDELDWYFLTSAKQHDIVVAGVGTKTSDAFPAAAVKT